MTPDPSHEPASEPEPQPTPAPEPAPRRRGRPARRTAEAGPGARERILASARGEFAEHGYDKVSVRAIARGAGVDAALVHHYFGTKEQVFAAAVEGAMAPVVEVPALLEATSREALGETITRAFLGIWEDPATREPVLAIVRSAVNNERAAAVFRGLLTPVLLSRVASLLPEPDAELRVSLAAAQLVGVALLRHVIRLEPVASEPLETAVARLAPVVQHHLTGPTGARDGSVHHPDPLSGS
ncbi:TetR family transcriptional regulator [Streptomyces oryzae]|uniref:TetR family transcriptional regulator n=1 Tax=Streptomyces oryzae TaxID=1434886 RepID=A0ABS3XL01_9ACTN|nr:TetR family transcriptional regulator [Streptomyces oryzae]MBO8196006.1 TetR family transcriptional regulator [Streptomyces oryzae]